MKIQGRTGLINMGKLMNKYLLTVSMGLLSSSVMAATPIYQPIGSSTVLGGYANRHALSTSLANPAAPYLMTNIESFRFGFLGPLDLGYETGEIRNLDDRVDELEGLLEANYSSTSEANNALARANSIVNEIGETAYGKVSGSVQAPFMPIIYKTNNRGAFILDASASLVSKASVLADDIDISVSGTELTSDTSLFIKRATDYRFGLGYSQALGRPVSGALIVGGRVNFHNIALDKKVSVLTDAEDNASDEIKDFLSDRGHVDSGIGVDLGAIWTAPNYQLGASLANINEPEFDFGELGNCSGLSGSDLTNCNAAVNLSNEGKLKLKETYKMKAQLTLDAAVMSNDQHWSLSGVYDVNGVEDPVGDKYQWQIISLSYFSDNLVMPGVRVGYRKNLAGTKLSYATLGATLFRRLDFDLAYGLEKVESGSDLPRSMYFSVAYNLAF